MKKFLDLYARYLSVLLVLLCAFTMVSTSTRPVIDGVYMSGSGSIRFSNGLCLIEKKTTPIACVFYEQDGVIYISGISQNYNQSFRRNSVYSFGDFFSIKAFLFWAVSIMLSVLSLFYLIYCWARYFLFKDEIRSKWKISEKKN